MKITKILTASAVALTLALGAVIPASAEEETLAAPKFTVLESFDELENGVSEVTGEFFFAWLEENYEYAKSITTDYLDVIVKKASDDGSHYYVEYVQPNRYDFFEALVAADGEFTQSYPESLETMEEYKSDDGDVFIYIAPAVDLVECDVSVDTDAQKVTVTYNGEEMPSSDYTVTYYGVDNNYEGTDFPTEPGEYSVTVVAKEGSYYVKDANDNGSFTIEAPAESSEESSESTVESESESTVESEETSETESTADTSSKTDSSKADTSSKATSDSSTKNPGTGAAAAMGILAVAAAGVAVSKKKSK
ncbi:MAG: hypothetical protein IJM87_07225 [Ruminococcus sp.]|nr:hypothetical protein [Ruminococcus sp.]